MDKEISPKEHETQSTEETRAMNDLFVREPAKKDVPQHSMEERMRNELSEWIHERKDASFLSLPCGLPILAAGFLSIGEIKANGANETLFAAYQESQGMKDNIFGDLKMVIFRQLAENYDIEFDG
jgi:hypothetical protein